MGGAEEVLIEAAERVSATTRALWRRQRDCGGAGDDALGDARRRLAVWLSAGFGTSWPLLPADAPAPPGWLARALGSLPPWSRAPLEPAFSDGHQIFLPRSLLLGRRSSGADAGLLLVTALGLGVRLVRRSLERLPADPPLARDLAWIVEGACADAALARSFPGLAPQIEAARRAALRARPPLARLRPVEARVEALVVRLLRTPLGRGDAALGRPRGAAPEPARIARFAERLASALGAEAGSRYRGVAPVPHWGVPRPDLVGGAARPAAGGEPQRPLTRQSARRLARRVERRALDAGKREARPGPFVPSPAETHLSLQDPAGLERPLDQADLDPAALAQELAAQDRIPSTRSGEPVREVLEGEPARPHSSRASAEAALPEALTFAYPEWDFSRAAYRPAACRVREATAPRADAAWVAQVRRERATLLLRLRRQFEAFRPRRVRVTRQLDGDDLDIDGWVEEYADRCAGRAPAGRLYASQRRRRREVSVALLVDASASTDAWISGRQRVIDVEKEAALCLCEALASLGDRHAVYAFSGQGAADVRVWPLKRFEEAAGEGVLARIGGLEPDAFTRLGGPIRHVAAELARERARARLLLLLSDGRPNDEDGYEGEYGIEDVRQAVCEARAEGTLVHCATIDREGPEYLPHLFGPHGYSLLSNATQLPERLPELYRRLTAAQ